MRTLYGMGVHTRAHMFSVLIEHFLNPWLTLTGHVETTQRMAIFQWMRLAGKTKTEVTVRVRNQRQKHGWATEVCPACERPLGKVTSRTVVFSSPLSSPRTYFALNSRIYRRQVLRMPRWPPERLPRRPPQRRTSASKPSQSSSCTAVCVAIHRFTVHVRREHVVAGSSHRL